MKYKRNKIINTTSKVEDTSETLNPSNQELQCLIEAMQIQLNLAKFAVESMEKNLVALIELLNENND